MVVMTLLTLDWHFEIAEKLELAPIYEPVLDDFLLLFLYLDGRTPFYGEETLHLCFFLYPYVSVKASPSVFLPFSQEIEDAILRLRAKDLVEEGKDFRGGRYVSMLKLSDIGVSEARKVFSTFANSWILLNGFVLRRGSEVLSELEALKKTYNGKSPLELLRVMALKIDSEGEVIIKRLGFSSERQGKMIIDMAKQLARELKILMREHPY